MTNNILNDDQRLNLQKMISANDAEDFTEQIRNNKQSPLIKTDVNHLLFIKNKYSQLEKSDPEEFNKVFPNG